VRLSSSKSTFGEFKTLEGNHILRLPVQDDELAPMNKPCFLAIRPEHLLITRNSEQSENVLPARVRELNFSGATSSIRLDANGLQLEALVLEPDNLAIGDACLVRLPAERLMLLKNRGDQETG
jgi:ABC-type Fe3+/spermidine/putrescine transport system ATPase subunit